jgi:hypothetical protein
MTQRPTILWPYCQPTLHGALLAGVGLVRGYKNDRNGLMSLCSFKPIRSNVRRPAPDHRAIARTIATSSSDESHPIAIGM